MTGSIFNKILIALGISLIISISLFSFFKKDFNLKYDYRVNYDHISRKLNMDYEIISGLITYRFVEKFNIFANELDDKIRSSSKSCQKLQEGKAVSTVVTKVDSGQLSIQMIDNDKSLILKCSQFIEKEISLFNKKSIDVTTKLMENMGYNTDATNSNTSNEKTNILMAEIDKRFFNLENLDKLNIEEAINLFFLQKFIQDEEDKKKLEQKMLTFTGNVNSIQFITKSSEKILEMKSNKVLLFISTFLSTFIISIIIIFRSFRKTKNNIFSKFLNEIK